MSSYIAKRWLLPDSKWRALIEDYAFVNQSASSTRRSIDRLDHIKPHQRDRVAEPCECFIWSESRLECCCAYHFSVEGQYALIYADVDDTKPEHKKMLVEKAWTEELLKEEETEYAAIRKIFIAADVVNDDTLKFRERLEASEQPEETEALFFALSLSNGRRLFDPPAMDFLFTLESPHDRHRFLHVFSGKTRVRHKRPIMLLICMVDTGQTTVPDSTGGYAIAFNVLEERLIIKSYYCKRDTHPLTSPWTTSDPSDEINFHGTPLEFAREYVQVFPVSNSIRLLIRVVVHGQAAEFLLRHWTGLFRSVVSSEEAKSLESQVKKIRVNHIALINMYRIPPKAKVGENVPAVLKTLRRVENALLDAEEGIRDSAVKVEGVGKEKVVEHIAKVYEKLLSIVGESLQDLAKGKVSESVPTVQETLRKVKDALLGAAEEIREHDLKAEGKWKGNVAENAEMFNGKMLRIVADFLEDPVKEP